jgi:hypothetical protein
MPTQVVSEPTVQPALLFMPDISGFTEFVNQMEILHAQSIVRELLEVIIESNQINLQVSEIEGDAIFFYRLGNAPTMEQLLDQVQLMFTRFHQQLQRYDHERICTCGACKSAKGLKLKFFAHYGDVASHSVKEHNKLFGKDIIVLHRLLKNSLDKKEYALLTNSIIEKAGSSSEHPLYSEVVEAVEHYDVGEIHFKVVDLALLLQQIPPVELPTIHLSDKTKVAFSEERVLIAPIEKVFFAIFDLPQKSNWMEGVKGIEIVSKGAINRVGTVHRCLASTGGNPVFVTEKGNGNEKEIVLVEMDPRGIGGSKYYLQKKGEKETLLKWDMLVNSNFFISLLFNLFMQRKMKRLLAKSVDNLQHYCDKSDDNN